MILKSVIRDIHVRRKWRDSSVIEDWPDCEGEALLGPCPMHIVTIAKDGNGRYRSPTVSRPYLAIVVRRLRSRRVRESERRLPYRYM